MADNKLLLLGAAGVAVWWFYFRNPSTAAPVATVAPAAPDPNAIQGANSVAGIFAKTVAAAKPPSAGLGVDDWNYALNQVLTPLGKAAPDPMPLFTAAVPGFDRSQLLTAGQYWSVMGPAVKTLTGLSGLGFFGGDGLGRYRWVN